MKAFVSYDIGEYKKRIDNGINKYLRDKNVYLNESQNNDIENMKATILNIIDSELQIINFSDLSKSNAMIIVSKIISVLNSNIVLISAIVVNILIKFILCNMEKKKS